MTLNLPHILLIPSWYPPNGGTFAQEQSELLHKKGYTIGVAYVELNSLRQFTPKNLFKNYFQTRISNENGLTVIRVMGWYLPKLGWLQYKLWTWLMVKSVQKYIDKFGKPDLMHVHSSLWGSIVAAKIKQKYKIPYVITEHRGRFGYLTNMAKSQFKPWYKGPLKEGISNTDMLIPVSKILIKKLHSFVPSQNIPTTVIPNIVNVDFFSPAKESQKHQHFTFLLIAGLTPVKGVDNLIPAFMKVLKLYSNIKLRIGGDGHQKACLEQLASDLNSNDSISFLGELTQEQVKEEMGRAHFFVLASRIEAQPVVTCEAMAMGVPVLATSVVSDDVVTPDTGILVDPDSVEALEKGLIQAIKTKDRFDPAKIRQFAVKNFSYDAVFAQIESVYGEVLKAYEN
jgi:L-malate glycosyltransferase